MSVVSHSTWNITQYRQVKQAKASIPCAVKNDVSKDNTPIQKNDTAIVTETFDLHQVKLYQNIGATYHNGQTKIP